MDIQHLQNLLSRTTSHLKNFTQSFSSSDRSKTKIPPDLLQELKESNATLLNIQETAKTQLNNLEINNLVACLDNLHRALQIFQEKIGIEQASQIISSVPLPNLRDNLVRVKSSLERGRRVENTGKMEQLD